MQGSHTCNTTGTGLSAKDTLRPRGGVVGGGWGVGTRGGLVNKSPGLGCGDVQARLRQSLGAWWASICPIVDKRRLRALEAEARLWCVWASAHAQLLVAAVARSALGDRPCCSIVDQRRLRALEAEARL